MPRTRVRSAGFPLTYCGAANADAGAEFSLRKASPSAGRFHPVADSIHKFPASTLSDVLCGPFGLSDGEENKSGITVYHPCITEQMVGG